MSLSRNDLNLLFRATNIISNDSHRKYMRERLISIANSTAWFKDFLMKTLATGLTFSTVEKQAAGVYTANNHRISMHISYFGETEPKELLDTFFSNVLRHEMTHAFDYQEINSSEPSDNLSVDTRMSNNAKLVDLLYDKITCMDKYNYINSSALDQLSPLLDQPRKHHFGALHGFHSHFKQMDAFLKHVGGYFLEDELSSEHMKQFKPFVLKKWVLANQIGFYDITHDPIIIYERFNAAKNNRDSDGLQRLETYFYNHFNLRKLALWSDLNIQQRSSLSALYFLQTRIHEQIAKDELCFPKFVQCLDMQKYHCFLKFLNCQRNNNVDAWTLSHMESSAILREYSDANLLDLKTLDNLCVKPLPTNTQKIQPDEISSLAKGLHSSIYSFTNELAKLYLQNKKFKHMAFGQLLVSITLFSIVTLMSSVFSNKDNDTSHELGLGCIVLLLKFAFDHLLANRFSSTTKMIIEHAAVGVMTMPQIISSGPKQVAANFVVSGTGSYIGSTLARSMSRALGWKTDVGADKERSEFISDNSQKLEC